MFEQQTKFRFLLFFTYFNLCAIVATTGNSYLSRTKRTLVWEKGSSRLQIITGFGVPVDLSLENVIIGAVIKGNYVLPSNSSDLKPFGNVYYQRRKKRTLSRWDIYEVLAQLWQQRGFGGKSCVLKAICELSYRPVDRSYGLFDELIHAIFTPTVTREVLKQHSDNEYYAAQKIGRKSGDACTSLFPDCSVNLVDLFTV